SLLGPYLESLGVWRCPADKSMSTIGGRRYPHVRTVSMNNWVGDYDTVSDADGPYAQSWGSGFRIFRKTAGMVDPGPARIFVLLDERDDSINDSYFVTRMFGYPKLQTIVDVPSNYHNNAGGFNFADGHSEIHKWHDSRLAPPHVNDVHLPINTAGTPSPN